MSREQNASKRGYFIVVVKSTKRPWYKEDRSWCCLSELEATKLVEWLKPLVNHDDDVIAVSQKEWQEIPWKVET